MSMAAGLLFWIIGFFILEFTLQNKRNAEKLMSVFNIKSVGNAKIFFIVGLIITIFLAIICEKLTRESNIVKVVGMFIGISISAITKRSIEIIKNT
ncbi:hypothetical protein [Clostridium sp. UBA4548]|uniref:hypothetical protein n=1 Tax=Clostridium sp. UBA4548 TaxID=1946361 RepID=UPI0025BC4AD1|nr:hypothetical protein [Clostridium sp. UBA4548]